MLLANIQDDTNEPLQDTALSSSGTGVQEPNAACTLENAVGVQPHIDMSVLLQQSG